MKPRVTQEFWRNVSGPDRAWHIHWVVTFEDGCGCEEQERFPGWARAVAFANNIARGIERWYA